ncbi:unnamed protein product [Protopolystoma xenopodis]|uniref:Uncharacterized protein n=1 Tax=Protopolystoma xenopodis TaxID=117903 RepID=A0A448XCW6_9PLAT|nr:unnamed protein product [Protopolystoma xenopodis]
MWSQMHSMISAKADTDYRALTEAQRGVKSDDKKSVGLYMAEMDIPEMRRFLRVDTGLLDDFQNGKTSQASTIWHTSLKKLNWRPFCLARDASSHR